MFFVSYDRGPSPWTHEIDPHAVITRLSPYTTPDKSGFLVKDRVFLVQAVHWNTPSSLLEPVPFYHAPSETTVVSWARIDNGEELAEALGISRTALKELSDSELILQSYLKWGEECVHYLVGDFVFVIYDGKQERLFCGRDHMGVRPFYYFLSPERFVCATSLAALVQPGSKVPVEVETQWVAEYLCGLSMSFDRTAYREIHKLPPACSLTVTANNAQMRQYFQFSGVEELRLKDSIEYVEMYQEQLERAVKCCVRTNYALGSELSGGLDSSTVTAYAAKFFSRPLSCFHAFAFADCELEPGYIEAVSHACQLPHIYIFRSQGQRPADAVERALTILGYPVEHNNSTHHEPFYKQAEALNIRTLLSGFGGDEFTTTIHGYLAPVELLMARRFKDVLNILPGSALFRFLRLVKLSLKEMKSHYTASPEYNPVFYDAYLKRLPRLLIREDIAEQFNLKDRYLDQARFDAGYRSLRQFTLEKRWQPFVPTRLEECSLMAVARRIEYRWPLLDIRLVKLFLSIPAEEHYFRGMGRYLHRRAVAGTVPDLVAWKPSKDMGSMGDSGGAFGPLLNFSTKNLHPGLVDLLDIPKLNRQVGEMSPDRLSDTSLGQHRCNLRAITYLDYWLKHHVP